MFRYIKEYVIGYRMCKYAVSNGNNLYLGTEYHKPKWLTVLNSIFESPKGKYYDFSKKGTQIVGFEKWYITWFKGWRQISFKVGEEDKIIPPKIKAYLPEFKWKKELKSGYNPVFDQSYNYFLVLFGIKYIEKYFFYKDGHITNFKVLNLINISKNKLHVGSPFKNGIRTITKYSLVRK